MIEEHFKTELRKLEASESLIVKLWDEIVTNYSASSRHYHTMAHLNSMIQTLLPVRNKILDWQIVVCSIAYHDIIYNPLRKDNESKSAAFAEKRLALLGLPSSFREKCAMQILATKNHQVNEDGDTNYFTDADLAILGSDSGSYAVYTNQIRKEYSYYPDIIYKPGRRKVLQHFLQMETIFKTKHFGERYEEQARSNLTNELQLLS